MDVNAGSSAQPRNVYTGYSFEQNRRLLEFYKKNNYPDECERELICAELGLDQDKVKFWFQNHRSKTRKKLEKSNTQALIEENEHLRVGIERDKFSFLTASCEHCNEEIEETSASRIELLKVENACMKEELDRINYRLAIFDGMGKNSPNQVDNQVENPPAAWPSNVGSSDVEIDPELIFNHNDEDGQLRD